MNPACLDYCLTEAERLSFEKKGFLILDQVLDEKTRIGLIAACDPIDAQIRSEQNIDPTQRLTIRDILWRHPLLLDLVDWPTTLPKIWGILGWNIQIYHSVIAYSPSRPPTRRQVTMQGWHQDSGRINRELECSSSPRPRVSVKVAFFLSDGTRPDCANFWAVPGSHLFDSYQIPADGSPPKGAEPILVPQGGALLFDRRLWHTASSNGAAIDRKVLFYGYSYRWLRPRDDQSVEALIEKSAPIRRQLLGYGPSGGFGYTSPTDEDVPLRGWLRQHLGEASVEP